MTTAEGLRRQGRNTTTIAGGVKSTMSDGPAPWAVTTAAVPRPRNLLSHCGDNLPTSYTVSRAETGKDMTAALRGLPASTQGQEPANRRVRTAHRTLVGFPVGFIQKDAAHEFIEGA